MLATRWTFGSWILLALAAGLATAIAALIRWGGRVEAALLVFGDIVHVTLDAGRPRVALLFVAPALLVAAAIAARRPRRPRAGGEPE